MDWALNAAGLEDDDDVEDGGPSMVAVIGDLKKLQKRLNVRDSLPGGLWVPWSLALASRPSWR